MRVATFMSGAAAIAVIGFLGFRILDLEQRVAALSEQLGAPITPVDDPPPNHGDMDDSPERIPPGAGFEQRLATLEKQLATLHAAQNAVASHTANTTPVHQDQEILSVVEREGSRIRDVQLEWHRSRWLEGRASQLNSFAKQFGLSQDQTAGMHGALQLETDAMVSVLKRPELAEDPDQFAADWQHVLDETDRAAQKVLTPEQNIAWTQARVYERGVLWPWLPKKQQQTAAVSN
jgi:hypothetical protein